MANATSQNQSVAEQLQKERQETDARLKEQAQKRLSEVEEQIGPLQQEASELSNFLGVEEKPSQAPVRRSRKGGTRREQAMKIVSDHPGITASEVAKTMKIQPNYLYRVLGDLVKDNEVRKEEQGYHPVSA